MYKSVNKSVNLLMYKSKVKYKTEKSIIVKMK